MVHVRVKGSQPYCLNQAVALEARGTLLAVRASSIFYN